MAGNRFGSSITQPLVAEGYEAVCVDCDGMLGVAKPVEREPDVDMKPSIVVVLNDEKTGAQIYTGSMDASGRRCKI